MIPTEKIWELTVCVLLAVAGGLARLLNIKDNKKLRWRTILSELFISGFAGLMVLLLARLTGLTGDWLGLVCGMAGWMGPRILEILSAVAAQAMGLKKQIDGGVQSDNNNKK